MQKIRYIFSTLAANKASTAVKILSLALGLTMCSFLFARIDHDNSFDNGFGDTETLAMLRMEYTIGGENYGVQTKIVYPLAYAAADDLSDLISSATIAGTAEANFMSDGHILTGPVLVTDSAFFKTMGVELIEGNADDITTPGAVFISDRIARKAFGDEKALGRTLTEDGNNYTVKGVFRSWGEETTLPADFIGPLNWYGNFYTGWGGGDRWLGYVRLREKPKDIEAINARLTAMFKNHYPDTESISVRILITPIRDYYAGWENVRHMTVTLSLLAIAILFISALNYVLLSLSSLSSRVKSIGVHKCSGAGTGTVFGMFLLETVIIILGALVLGAFFWWLSLRFAKETVYSNFASYLSMDRLWVVLAVTVLVFVIAALIPARIFSRVSVSHVFRRFREKRQGWKYALLFVEFGGCALVAGMVVVVSAQYSALTDSDTGFNTRTAVLVDLSPERPEQSKLILEDLRRQPYVKAAALSWGYPGIGYSGEMIRDNEGNSLFSSRFDCWGEGYEEAAGIRYVAGRPPKTQDETAVNEEFVSKMGWTNENAIGRRINVGETLNITGVIKNFVTASYYYDIQPFFTFRLDRGLSTITVDLKEPFNESYSLLEARMSELLPDRFSIRSVRQIQLARYSDVSLFRTLVTIACVIILLISAIGLAGYLGDEMCRRSKEMAVRKVNGATTGSIVHLICRGVLVIALPAVTVGTFLSWYLGHLWLQQFAMTIDNAWALFILAGICTLVIIVALAAAMTVRRASINPVNNLRSE